MATPLAARHTAWSGVVRDDARMSVDSEIAILAPMAGVVVAVAHEAGESVRAGTALVVLESMKMEHEVVAGADGVVRRVAILAGDAVEEGQVLMVLAEGEAAEVVGADGQARGASSLAEVDLDGEREDP